MEYKEKIFGELSTIKKFGKKEIILEKGKVENYLSYLIQGSIVQIIYHEGNEICIGFTLENSFFSSYTSFLTRQPSQFRVMTLEDTVIERISYDNLQKAYNYSGEHQKNGRIIAEQLYIKATQRALSLITKTADQRYLELIEKHPDCLQRIPLKYIASYLGITPVSLSRIRNNLAKSRFINI
jgi:CRP-like cAMP-binding protein